MIEAIRRRLSKALRPGEKGRTGRIALVLLVFGGVVLLIVQSYRAIDRELTDAALSRRSSIADLAAATLAEKFDHLSNLGAAFASRVLLPKLIRSGKWVEASEVVASGAKNFPFFDRMFLADPGGTLMADIPALPGVRGISFAHRDWYQGVSRNWEPYVSAVYARTAEPKLNVIAVAVPIRDANRIVIGILVLQVRLDAFFGWIKAIEMDPDIVVYVVDGKGRIAFHSIFPSQGELIDYSTVPAVRQVLQGKRGVEIAFNPIEGEERLSAYAPIGKYGWGIVAAQPVSSAFAAKNHQLARLLLAYALILLLCMSVMYLISRMVFQYRQAVQDRHAKTELEHRVVERTAQLQAANAELQTEIAERKRAQEELDRYFTVARDLFCIAGFNGYFKRLNPAWEKTLGWTVMELVARPLLEFVHPDDREATLAAVAQQAGGQEIISFENRYLHKDGSYKWLRWSSVPVTEQQLMFAVAYDLTERKQAEDQINKLNANLEQRAMQLEASNKELESFSYSVSHDLRSPLRAVDGYSQILEEDYAGKLDAEGLNLLGVIRESSQKMGILIDDLLTFSKLGRRPLTTAEVDMTALIGEVVRELPASGGGEPPQITVAGLPPTWGDRALLKQVWVNLLSNAIKFTGKQDQPRVEVSGYSAGAENVYSVKDNGAGFDMKYYDKLFGVFQRLHSSEQFPGTGVGLAIVQRVTTRHGGRVWAEGKIDQGATFYFALPKGGSNG